MYQHIMVPLDGSELAECVLPHVEMLAKSCQIPKVTLIRVATPLRLYSDLRHSGIEEFMNSEVVQQIENDNLKLADEYLLKQVLRLKGKGIEAKAEVVSGVVTDELISYAEKNGVDLVVIATHGRSGIGRWLMGSTAERILKTSKVPVLMVRPTGCAQ